MHWTLVRQYHHNGTNGHLYDDTGKLLCYTIELPWLNNAKAVSCIPEGSYILTKRYSKKFNWHLHVQQVPQREYILIHAANNALMELKGCIAPVSMLTAWGTGLGSRKALQKLMQQFDTAAKQSAKINLIIQH